MGIKQIERRLRHAFKGLLRPRPERATLALFRDPLSRRILRTLFRLHRERGTLPEYGRRLRPLRETCVLKLCEKPCVAGPGGPELPVLADEHQYFPADLITLGPEEVFLDAGAFTGDTVRSILAHTKGRFGAIHAFEPDRLSHARLCERVAALPPGVETRIHCHRMALSAEARTVRFASTGSPGGNIFGASGPETADAVEIHAVLPGEVLESLTFIKLDVEGAEMEVLRSLEREIRAFRPTLAVCVYHRREDLTGIPAYIHALCPEYRLFLRHHSSCRCETVLYALPPSRMAGRPASGPP